jgi:hypothetical protein
MDLNAYLLTRDASQDGPETMPVVVKGASRYHLAEVFRQRGYRTGAEIGVYKGQYSHYLCLGNPGVRHLCVDIWQPYENAKTGKTIFRSSIPAYDTARARLAPFDCTFMRKTSVEAAKDVPDKSLDYVYIDANHWFEFVVADLAAWAPKVRSGGMIAGHDWEDHLEEDNCVSVAVTGWTRTHHIVPWFVLGRAKTRRGEVRDDHRSWLWVVP